MFVENGSDNNIEGTVKQSQTANNNNSLFVLLRGQLCMSKNKYKLYNSKYKYPPIDSPI